MNNINFPDFLKDWNEQQQQTTPEVHLKLASWLEQQWERGKARILVMAFRGFGKSSVIGVFCTWLLSRNPDLRILVLAADMALARKMVRQVKRIIERHPETKALKPLKAEQWGGDCFTVKRRLELRDPSMMAKGISTNLTGSRADLVICDDVEVQKTSSSEEKREQLRERLVELEYILTPDGGMIYIGTPHCWDTIYSDEKKAGRGEIFLQDYARMVIPVRDAEGNSAWPENFPPERIEKIHEASGPNNFLSQMMCEPTNIKEGCFDTSKIIIYDDEITYSESGKLPILTIGGVQMTSAIAWWDPAFGHEKGDRSVLAVVFQGGDNFYYIHHIQQIMVKRHSVISEMDQQCEVVAGILADYFVPRICIEQNGVGMFLPGHLRRYLNEHNISCHIDEIHNRKPKDYRIKEGFEALLASGKLRAHRRAAANGLLRQLEQWNPAKKNQEDDVLDAVAGALSLQPAVFKASQFVRKPNWTGKGRMMIAKTILD